MNDNEEINIELTDKEWLYLAMAAHEQDITLNQYIINLLKKAMEHSKQIVSNNTNTDLAIDETL